MSDPLWLYDLAGSYQANFSIAQAKQEGYTGGVSKITEGLSGSDPSNQPNWDKVNKAWSKRWHDDSMSEGQIWGGYHFLHNGNGAAQARYFLDEFNKITGSGVDGYLVQCDCESDADWQTIQDFSNEFYRQTNDHPYLMYTGAWWWNVAGRRWDGNSLTPYLWHSEYVTGSGYGSTLYEQVTPQFWTPGYGNWPRATILQFSSKGSGGGMVANLDVNAFLGTKADLTKLTGGKVVASTGLTLSWGETLDAYISRIEKIWVPGFETISTLPGKLDQILARLDTLSAPAVALDSAAEQRIIDGVSAKILDAQKQPRTYQVTETA